MDHSEEEGARRLPVHSTNFWAELPKWYIEYVRGRMLLNGLEIER